MHLVITAWLQRAICAWNCEKLAEALKWAVTDKQAVRVALARCAAPGLCRRFTLQFKYRVPTPYNSGRLTVSSFLAPQYQAQY